jgi:hypothetical protein
MTGITSASEYDTGALRQEEGRSIVALAVFACVGGAYEGLRPHWFHNDVTAGIHDQVTSFVLQFHMI